MTYLLWSLPALVVISAIGSGRIKTTYAAILGLLIALLVAVLTGPEPFGQTQFFHALARGLWIGATITPYILGGILFWQVSTRGVTTSTSATETHNKVETTTTLQQRRLLFFACFLIGPFAESATGFGVGMLGTLALIRGLGIAPRYLMIFALLSQTMVPWGAMGSVTILAAAYAHISPAQMGLYAIIPVSLLMSVWLSLFWRVTRLAGFGASIGECIWEASWIAAALVLLVPATLYIGPETSLLAVYGPLICLRYLIDKRLDRSLLKATIIRILPFILLISGLVLTRLLPPIRNTLSTFCAVAPFQDLPVWPPFFHAGSWLFMGGIITSLLRKQGHLLVQDMWSAWRTGKDAVLAIFLFALMAETLSISGIAHAIAAGMFAFMHEKVVMVTPLLASVFGILANNGNAPNSLFMTSQLALAIQAGMNIPMATALLHVAGSSMGIFSPVRMSIAASLSHGAGQERTVYTMLLPYAFAALALLLLNAAWIVFI